MKNIVESLEKSAENTLKKSHLLMIQKRLIILN